MNPTVSVMMALYNAERYVDEAVQSILDQDFTDFELLIIDDGSTDRSLSIVEGYASRDPRIRLVSRENRGISATRNELMAMATGEFLAVMDADDVSLPHRFSVQVAYFREHPDVVCIGCGIDIIDERGRYLLPGRPAMDHEEIEEVGLLGQCPLCHSSMMFKQEAAQAAGGYHPDMQPAEDHDLILRLGELGRLVNLPDVMVKYRTHNKSVSVRQQQLQLDRAKLASDSACDRRGIGRRYIHQKPWRPTDRRSRCDSMLTFGWAGFMRGDRRLGLIYGARAVGLMPWRLDSWRLLACAALKPTGRGV